MVQNFETIISRTHNFNINYLIILQLIVFEVNFKRNYFVRLFHYLFERFKIIRKVTK